MNNTSFVQGSNETNRLEIYFLKFYKNDKAFSTNDGPEVILSLILNKVSL